MGEHWVGLVVANGASEADPRRLDTALTWTDGRCGVCVVLWVSSSLTTLILLGCIYASTIRIRLIRAATALVCSAAKKCAWCFHPSFAAEEPAESTLCGAVYILSVESDDRQGILPALIVFQ